MIDIRVQSGDFDAGRQIARLEELGPGGIATLIVHAAGGDEVSAVVIEHYAAMAKAELARIADEAGARWPLAGSILIHRHGRLARGERLLFVAVAARDHSVALEACTFLAGEVGRRAPFWRRDMLAGGGSRWAKGRG